MATQQTRERLVIEERTETERRILSTVQRCAPLPSAEIARLTGLSAQTASVVTRSLEQEGLLSRGEPQKGKVGKPSVPISLSPDGVFSFGLRIGRRTADLILLDLSGQVRGRRRSAYAYPTPGVIMTFIRSAMAALTAELGEARAARLCGLGVGAPFELWNWLESVGAPRDEMADWRGFDIARAAAAFTDLPVSISNDATLACAAEQVFGVGASIPDFAYFHVGSFIGGGLVVDRRVLTGRTGNAGALGSIPVGPSGAADQQLIHHASVYRLEQALRAAGREGDPRDDLFDWRGAEGLLQDWIDETAEGIARASVSVAAVLDLDIVVVDSVLPRLVLDRLVLAIEEGFEKVDQRGLRPLKVRAGQVGPGAGAIGAAYLPISSRYLLNGVVSV